MTNTILFQKTRKPHARPKITEEKDDGKILMLDIKHITANPAQPRRTFDNEALIRLADSIRQYGILQPLTVRRISERDFELIAGERRLRAAKLLGMLAVPCIIIDVSERSSAELAIIENVQRENLNMFEQASAIAMLIDIYDLTQNQVAKRLSLSQSYIANKLRILRLTSAERELILSENLTERHARALLRIDDIEKRTEVIKYIAKRRMNVAHTEEYIDKLLEFDLTPEKNTKILINDIKFFYNSVDNAIDIMKRAGVEIKSEKREADGEVELIIKITK